MLKTKHIVYCIMGRTASGKTQLTKAVAKDMNMSLLKSYTTRAMRDNERDDPYVDHTFISNEEADELLKNADVVAYTEINKIRYFATLQQLREADFYVIDPIGFEALQATLTNWSITDIEIIPIYISATKKVRKERYISRDECTEEDFEKRDESENGQFNRFELKAMVKDKKFMTSNTIMVHIIKNNGVFEDALNEFKKIVKNTK